MNNSSFFCCKQLIKSKTPESENTQILMIYTQHLCKLCSLCTRGWGGLHDIIVPHLPPRISRVHGEHKSTETDTNRSLPLGPVCRACCCLQRGEPVRGIAAPARGFRRRWIRHTTQAVRFIIRYLFKFWTRITKSENFWESVRR